MPISNVIWTLAAAAAFDEADAATISKGNEISAMFAARLRSHEDDLKKLHGEMSVDTAYALLQKRNSSNYDSLVELEGVQRPAKLRNKKTNSLVALRQDPTGYAAVDKAKKMLNDMVYEVKQKYEAELEKCCAYDASQSALIETTRQVIAFNNAKAAEARKDALAASAVISTCQKQIPALQDSLAKLNKQCTDEIAVLDDMLKTVAADIKVMAMVLEMTQCDSQTASNLMLMKCEDECGEYMKFKDSHEAPFLANSPRAQMLAARLFGGQSPDPNANLTTTTVGPTVIKRARPCKVPLPLDQRTGKCTISGNPQCAKLNERFVAIQTGIMETQRELKAKRQALVNNCQESRENFESQIRAYEQKLKDYSTKLAAATGTINEATEESRLKGIELKEFIANYDAMTEECHKNYDELESEQCALEKIRGEVFNKLKGDKDPAFFQDCAVTDWAEELPGCSKSCGGGLVKMVRTIATQPLGGAECPPLLMYKNCNEHMCPIDCKLSDWSGFSSCSAECGGGVRERQRTVEVAPKYDGEDCGDTSQVESCNPQSCDSDCVLGDWTAWSNCTSMCNGGRTNRVRLVTEPQRGGGSCPDKKSNHRFQQQTCNTDPCVVTEGQLLDCETSTDLVLVIDGSASMGEVGWGESIKAAEHIVKSIKLSSGDGSKVSVIVYSAPTGWCDYYTCMGEFPEGYGPEYCPAHTDANPLDCGAKIIQHFTDSEADLLTALQNAAFPAQTTFTSYALHAAKDELKLGSPDAQSVVVLLTDGVPNDPKSTASAADEVKKDARLIIVPVGQSAPIEDVKKWATDPLDVIPAKDFTLLASPLIINKIISTTCPNVTAGSQYVK